MELTDTIVRVYEEDDPAAAFRSMIEALSADVPVHCAAWIDSDGATLRYAHPADVELSPELLGIAAHAIRPELFPLHALLPEAALRFPDSEILVLPPPDKPASSGVMLAIAPRGSLGDDLECWQRLALALCRVEHQQRKLRDEREECKILRRRVEESEALHTLGLAANRTLDPEEVLSLVARFTRTLLGAHYVTVNTSQEGQIRTVASVGARADGVELDDALLARRIVDAAKPLTIGETGAHLAVADFPFHQSEGMQAGLGVPLSLFGETFGALVIGYRRPYEVTPRDTRLALTLAGHAAVAISNARLHERVAQRSEELEHAYEQLRQATHAKERFYNAVSHDLRSPIGAIKGYNDLLLAGAGGELSPKTRRYLENSRRSAATVLGLIGELLDFAKLEAGRMELNIRPCSVKEVFEDALSSVRPQAEAKGLRLEIGPLDGVPPLHTDPKRLCQILVNLLSNAVKFTPGGDVSLRAHIAGEPNPGAADASPELTIRISDTGPGIQPGDLVRIFEEFEQVAGSDGSGLGLPIARNLARLMGGDLLVESEVGAGSTFMLRLPIHAPAPAAVAIIPTSD